MILIEQNGERMLVNNLVGHEGAGVIASNVPEQPSEHHRLNAKGKWVEDAASREAARLREMSRSELIEEVIRRMRGA